MKPARLPAHFLLPYPLVNALFPHFTHALRICKP
jgi:hypothetical protein